MIWIRDNNTLTNITNIQLFLILGSAYSYGAFWKKKQNF